MSTVHPTQIGTTPTGYAASEPSELSFGRDVGVATQNVPPFGFGDGARPNFIERLSIFLTKNTSSDKTINGTLSTVGNVLMDATGLAAITTSNANAPSTFQFRLREVDVCEGGVAKKMVIMASQTYLP